MYALPFLAVIRLHQWAINARRRNRTARYFAWSVLAGVTAALMITSCAMFVWLCWELGVWWLGIAVGTFLLLPILGPQLVRDVLVPLGAVRPAFVVGCASRPGKDPVAYGLACGAWAVASARSPSGEAWILKRRDARLPLGDGEVVATALLVAARGDADAARLLLRSVTMLVEDHPSVRDLAGEWLAVDAAARGAWDELAADAASMRYPATPLTWLLEGIAAHHRGQDAAPSPFELWARWALAPRRRQTYALVTAALAPRPVPAPATETGDAPPAHASLPHAIAAHLAFGATEATAPALADTVRAWDAALSDGSTHTWLARRALELDAPLGAVDRALRDVSAAVTDELARIADAAQLGAPASHGPVGDGLARRLRHGRLDSLEAGFTRWAARRANGEVHPAIDEWREFVALQTAYTAAVGAGGLELRRLAFPHAFSTGSSMAAWLWNTRNEYVISHAISAWLLAEARLVGDAEAIELGHRNCALYVPTRSGDAARSRG